METPQGNVSMMPRSGIKSRLLVTMAMLAVGCLAAATAAIAEDGEVRIVPEGRTKIVVTSGGPIVGVRSGRINWFLGIPFAAAPTGRLRWRPPEAPQRWSKPRDATTFGGWCMQVAPEGFSKPTLNEDCLYLNVMAPADALSRKKKRAVMVWIYGGGLRQGRANDYDPTLLVEKGDVVFVSFNYRLNILGFLAHPSLDKEGHSFANYGLMDQQFAMEWVRKNIAAFGGDPNNVTLIGESAGGANVFNHLASPKSVDLFDKAIVQSGSLWYGRFAPFYDGLPLAEAEKTGEAAAVLLGCPRDQDASCLRRASIEALADVIKKIPTYSFGVVVDGTIMPKSTSHAISSGAFKHVPIINGSNHNEWTWVEGLGEAKIGRPLAESEMKDHLADTFGGYAEKVVPHYPVSAFGGSAGAASAQAVTDGLFICPMLALNETLAKYTKVWGYEFNDIHAPYPFRPASFSYGAAHTLEMRYLFKNYVGAVGEMKPLSSEQQDLSNIIVEYWTEFAKTGDPDSNEKSGRWRRFEDGKVYLSIDTPRPETVSWKKIDTEHQCSSFWHAEKKAVLKGTH